MQNNKYWPKRPYNSRDNSWVSWNSRNERNSTKYSDTWYNSYAEEPDASRQNFYTGGYFPSSHLSDNIEKYPKYFATPELQSQSDNRGGKALLVTPVTTHSPPQRCSASPNASHFELSPRITSPRPYGALSPHSHHTDVVSPRQYHSEINSPRLNHRTESPCQQYFNASNRHSLLEMPSSKRFHMDAANSSPEARFYHSRESSMNTQTAFMSSPPQNNSFHSNSEYSNRYSECYRGWSSEQKYYRPSIHHDRRHSKPLNKTYRSKSSRFSPESSCNTTQEHKLSNHCSKTNNIAKQTPSAPAVEKSITNLLNKLFTEGINDQSQTLNNQNSEKGSKSQGESTSSSDENKAKSKVASANSLQKKKKVLSLDKANVTDNGLQLQDKNLKNASALVNGCSPVDTQVVESSSENQEKDIATKKKLVPKYEVKNSPSTKLNTFSSVPEVPLLNCSELKGENLKLGKISTKGITECNVHRGKLLLSSASQQKVKIPVSLSDKFTVTCATNSSSDIIDVDHKILRNKDGTKDGRINGEILFNAPPVINSSCLSVMKNMSFTGNETKLSCEQSKNEKKLCSRDTSVKLKHNSAESAKDYKARKTFPQKGSIIDKHSVVTEKLKLTPKVISKKQKKRHFRGGRYDLSINGQIKRKKRKPVESKLSFCGNDDGSKITEKGFKENINSQLSEVMSVNTVNSSYLCCTSDNDLKCLELTAQYKEVTSVHSFLKMSLKDVLWSQLSKSQNSFVENDEKYVEFGNEHSKNSLDCGNTATLNPCKEHIEKVNSGESSRLARKTQSSRVASNYIERTVQMSSGDLIQEISDDESVIEVSQKVSVTKPNDFNSNFSPQLRAKPPHGDLKAERKSSKVNEQVDIDKTSDHNSIGNEVESERTLSGDESERTLSGDESYVIGTSSSSDSDHEITFKKRRKGEMRCEVERSQAVDICEKMNSLDSCDVGIEALYSKDYKTSRPICTCVAKPLCDTNINTDDGPLLCQAVDTIDTELVTCTNKLSKSNLVRPSVKIPCIAMCDFHLLRLQQHQCCPNCGFFCTQGNFLQCVSMDPKTKEHQFHFFHDHCENMIENGGPAACPHCGIGSDYKTVKLKLSVPCSPRKSAEIASIAEKLGLNENELIENISLDHLSEKEISMLSKDRLLCVPDKLQMESMLKSLATEKTFNLRPSGKSFYGPIRTGDVDKVLNLLAMGVDPNHKFEHHNNDTPLHVAASAGFPILVHILVQAGACIDILNNNLYTPMMLAVEKNHLSIVQYLLMCGAQEDARSDEGMTCLHLATSGGHLEISKIFINSEKAKINEQDDGGWTPLVWAAEHKHLEIVKLLLEKGADTTIRDNEQNVALHWAAYSGNADIALLLLEAGCGLHAVNEHGDSPLHIAAREDNNECVVLFIGRGAVPNLQNNDNKTPAMCCQNETSQTWMTLSMIKKLRKWKECDIRKNELVIYRDISRGKEDFPIQVVNGVDNEPVPTDFLYIMENCETSQVNLDNNVLSLQSCKCDGDCSSKNCCCSILSFRCWYDKNGCLLPQFNLTDPPMIFECNRTCLCWKSCINRVVQHGITCRLQMFRTQSKGWGVRTLKDIPKGTFICEYIGEILSDLEADHRDDDSYLFDLDNRDTDIYCLDARHYGNISRFINHQCDPNLVPVKVFIDHQDLKFPRMAFFSTREIKAYEELGFDYGEKFWIIKCKWFLCSCGALSCKYSKDTIDDTLRKYHIRTQNEQDSIS